MGRGLCFHPHFLVLHSILTSSDKVIFIKRRADPPQMFDVRARTCRTCLPPPTQGPSVKGRGTQKAESHWLLKSASTRPALTTALSPGESPPITVKRQGLSASVSSRRLEPCPCRHPEHLLTACRLLFPNGSVHVCLLSSGTRASKGHSTLCVSKAPRTRAGPWPDCRKECGL